MGFTHCCCCCCCCSSSCCCCCSSSAEQHQWLPLIQCYLQDMRHADQDQAEHTPSHITHQRRMEVICTEIRGGCLKAATRLLNPDTPPPPSQHTTQQILDLFASTPLTQQQHDMLLAETAKVASTEVNTSITPKHIQSRMDKIKPAAHPGAGAARSSHILAIGRSSKGPAAILRWSKLWASGDMPCIVAQHFMHCMCRPRSKPKGGVRPIVLFSCLFKLALWWTLAHNTSPHCSNRSSMGLTQRRGPGNSFHTPEHLPTLTRNMSSWQQR